MFWGFGGVYLHAQAKTNALIQIYIYFLNVNIQIDTRKAQNEYKCIFIA